MKSVILPLGSVKKEPHYEPRNFDICVYLTI
jgi:hypothetical protein